MELPLDPDMALASLAFGSPRRVVRAFFGSEPQLFRRTESSREDDYWAQLGVFASYDDAETLESLELAAPANPSFSGEILTSLSFQEAKRLLRRVDETMEDESGSAISRVLGIAIWAGSGEDGSVQSVLRFAPGYYD